MKRKIFLASIFAIALASAMPANASPPREEKNAEILAVRPDNYFSYADNQMVYRASENLGAESAYVVEVAPSFENSVATEVAVPVNQNPIAQTTGNKGKADVFDNWRSCQMGSGFYNKIKELPRIRDKDCN